MAFVSRAERKLFIYQNSSNVGPGSYNSLSQCKKPKNKVPFISSTEKSGNFEPRAYTPGPGSYIDVFERRKPVYNHLHSSAFASHCDRFLNKTEEVPGPGTYNVKSSWTARRNEEKSENPLNWIRLPSAPSIPNSGLGYEENDKGELVKVSSESGDKDNLGPGYYNPKLENKVRGLRWMPPKRNVIGGFTGKPPGPGAYDISVSKPRYKEKPSACFLTKEKKITDLYQESEKDVPGPGKYLLSSKLGAAKNPYAAQNFGSGCERFRSKTPEPSIPGPGSYTLDDSIKNPQNPKAPFHSKRPRFIEKTDNRPGPGSYEPEEGPKKPVNPFCTLGGYEQRFQTINEVTPGPGAYTVQAIGKNSAKQKGLSVFISKSKRLSKSSQEITPAPGSYDIAGKIGEVKQVGSVVHPILIREGQCKVRGFNVQSNRFSSSKSSSPVPGPGAYKPNEPKSTKAIVFHKNQRFKPSKSSSPGPGAYPETHSWNKKTFNTLFDYK